MGDSARGCAADSNDVVPYPKGYCYSLGVQEVGAVVYESVGSVSGEKSLFNIMGYLQFFNNKSSQARTDRTWMLRPVVDVMQGKFARGYTAPPVIGFDEATIPSRSRYNPCRSSWVCAVSSDSLVLCNLQREYPRSFVCQIVLFIKRSIAQPLQPQRTLTFSPQRRAVKDVPLDTWISAMTAIRGGMSFRVASKGFKVSRESRRMRILGLVSIMARTGPQLRYISGGGDRGLSR
ncbi:hypothetical protein F444_23146 [Phytophthora nicotianae P1976]|uniref:PiggyBac transposable element-derived protein domain-containing protein n=1 Tax=Phytophthora nicotianae P1976 TaxID=1317066 RepID=A0A080YVR8_PHYNI|nr:hypothetical protein F444_23146 [Phytophthora nicotianae P1976]